MGQSAARGIARRVWRRLEASPAAPLAWRIRLLPRRLGLAIGRALAGAGSRFGGSDSLDAGATQPARSSWGRLPRNYAITPRPRAIRTRWPDPPTVADPGRMVRTVYDTGTRPPVMDLALLESLNEEYRSKPLVPEPPKSDQESREARARGRLLDVHHAIDLAGKRVLELGCGSGFEVWYLSHHFDADAWGVDVSERAGWTSLADERTHFVCADIGEASPFEARMFDRVISFSVLEHVVHPYAVLKEIYRILAPGGLAWISANLHRGPRASHLYRELYFPFPHLLFSDDVISAYRQKHHGRSGGASWVNRLTWAQYEDYLREIGFTMHALRFSETPLDEEFYERFSHILGRYPKWDLTKDFFQTVLEKPRLPAR
jgi:SAM-dependent methyltransferase